MRYRRVPATPPPVGETEEWCNACSRTDPRAGADPIHRKTVLDQHRCFRDDPRLKQSVRAELHGGKSQARGDASFWLRLDRRLRAADHLPDADDKRSRGDRSAKSKRKNRKPHRLRFLASTSGRPLTCLVRRQPSKAVRRVLAALSSG